MNEPDPVDERRVVVITGASSGIGRATAIELWRRGGVRLVLTARRRDALVETVRLAREAGGGDGAEASLEPCDLTDDDALQELASRIRTLHGDRVDALVNNAGVGSMLPFEHPDALADVDRQLALDLRAPIALTHALLEPLERARGTVVNVTSVAGLVGTPGSPAYSAAKWGLNGFSEAMHARLSPGGMRVVRVQPGPVPTPGWPHERLMRSRWSRLLACDAETIARCIADACTGRSRALAPVRPRTYALVPWMRVLTPWLLRRLVLAGGVRAAEQAAGSDAGIREG